MNPIFELNITWEVTWTPENSDEERKEYTSTTEYFYEDDGVTSLDNFFDQAEEMLGDNRFEPEAGIDQYLDEGGDVNIEYVKICDSKFNELWRDPDYEEDESDLNDVGVEFDNNDVGVELDDEDAVNQDINFERDEDDWGLVSNEAIERESWSKEKWLEHVNNEDLWFYDLSDEDQKCSEFDKSELLDDLMNDKERSLKILKEDGFFIERLSQELKSDKDIAIAAVSPKNGGGPAYRDLDESIKNDPDVIAATKKGNLAEGYDENEGLE
jgi:hypothetical protein